MAIPLISPIEVWLPAGQITKLLPPPDELFIIDADYTIHEPDVVVPVVTVDPAIVADPAVAVDSALTALDEIEHATRISEYHDFAWWNERITEIRAALDQCP